MPIYAYRCSACGFEKDVLQKMSDSLLTICPECQTAAFEKQVTAAGFQLKGNGWYATDFKNGNKPAAKGTKTENAESAPSVTAPSEAATAAATPVVATPPKPAAT
ncbi:MAG: zinc ribbon domain-containing protein [Verrucomicrobia bacterium]|nr:MAG: zinc ribbon domain-containing protein [Verrucomicrobiota bacterium]